jgi:hypothetical protein
MKKTLLALVIVAFVAGSAHAQMPGLCECYGGVDEEMNWWYLLDYYGYPLESGDWVYAAWVGPDGQIDQPNVQGYPTGDDLLIQYQTGDYINYGLFYINVTTFPPDDSYDRRPQYGDLIYCRMLDGPKGFIGPDNYYGNSQLYEVKYWPQEEFFCLFPGDPGGGYTDTPVYEGGCKDLTVYGGLDTTDMSQWPLTDIDGLQLEDRDLVQLIWAGPDGLVDPLNDLNGRPTGDDRLLADWGIGHGFSESGTGRFEFELCTIEAEPPSQGDVIYLRVFNDSTTVGAHYYGESEVHVVAYELGEVYPSFPDDAPDVVISNPCFTSVEEWTHSDVFVPMEYALFQNYPNPFNDATEIKYAIPVEGWVSLTVYDIRGAKITTLVDGHRDAGLHSVHWAPGGLASGVYFCWLESGEFGKTIKMVLLK